MGMRKANHKLTLRAVAWSRTGQSMDTSPREVIQYRVGGMPPGERATIWHPSHKGWCFKRTINEEEGEWAGNYDTAEEALAGLETELN